jgi:hypothetical protein
MACDATARPQHVLGDWAGARSLYERLIACFGPRTSLRSLLADIAAHPERARAPGHYRHALALAEPRGMRPLVADCHLGLGKVYRRTDKRRDAQEHLNCVNEDVPRYVHDVLAEERSRGPGSRSHRAGPVHRHETPSGRLLFHMLAAIAEFERGSRPGSRHGGLRRPRAQGRHLGRPRRHHVVDGEGTASEPLERVRVRRADLDGSAGPDEGPDARGRQGQ